MQHNPYSGVNAHLHSLFQAQGGWASFHAMLIASIARLIDRQLPDAYVVSVERSLQIREVHPDASETLYHPEPDATIFQRRPAIMPQARGATPLLTQPIPDTYDLDSDDLYLNAVTIYRAADHRQHGRPLTQIEVLSPKNKTGKSYLDYSRKRIVALESGLALIEIDLLHESRPVLRGIPRYPDAAGSVPYTISVSTPYPSADRGLSSTYGWHVDEPLPLVAIPLGAEQAVEVDFDAIYADAYGSTKEFRQLSDLSAPPLNLHRYSPDDQARIAAVMARAAQME